MTHAIKRPLFYGCVAVAAIWIASGSHTTAAATPPWALPWMSLAVPAPKPAYAQIRALERTVIMNHEVQKNEDLWSISKRYGIDQFTLRSSNDLDLQTVAPGMVLKIPNHRGTLYEVKQGETLESVRNSFARGRALGENYRLSILDASGYPLPDLKDPNRALKPGTLLFLPDAWKPMGLYIPFTNMNYRVTSRFGTRKHPVLGITRAHKGMDLAKPYGSPVTASRTGRVVFTGWSGGYGNLIQIRSVLKSKNGSKAFIICYGHLSKILVREGQTVRTGQLIGRVGSTGISTGPHLHFEIRDENGSALNPQKYL